MDSNVQTLDSKQAFRWKAARFSFLAPLGCAFIIVLSLSSCSNIGSLGERLILAGVFLIQFLSFTMGIFGMCANGTLAKALALVGILFSCIVGFAAFFLSIFSIWGFWSGC